LTKREGRVGLFRMPTLDPHEEVVLDEVGMRDDMSLVTGADMSPDGRRFVVRTHYEAREFVVHGSMKSTFEGDWIPVPLARERKGEAIAYTHDGGGLVTTSEKTAQPLHFYECI